MEAYTETIRSSATRGARLRRRDQVGRAPVAHAGAADCRMVCDSGPHPRGRDQAGPVAAATGAGLSASLHQEHESSHSRGRARQHGVLAGRRRCPHCMCPHRLRRGCTTRRSSASAPTPSTDLWSLDTFGRNLTWWVIGATGGAAVGGNLGGLVAKVTHRSGSLSPDGDPDGSLIFP